MANQHAEKQYFGIALVLPPEDGTSHGITIQITTPSTEEAAIPYMSRKPDDGDETDLSSLISDPDLEIAVKTYDARITERRSKTLARWIPITLAVLLSVLALGPLAYLFLVHPESLMAMNWFGLVPGGS